ncbi:T9SS type B sorting domain-containing protein [Galbibacter mesophilus]|uniref:T9SS type B sorting domain-containing protein n=1 Tax=Galbibacter mesophilus TaxID=379069 RepID=UPI00191CDE1B|nr:T9SS type B sorting domain-containing protein [Galbibacter mesophilus]MCM5662288.1 T9SS type B sorting domain-containing protein [Galbibacter mesophilus]
MKKNYFTLKSFILFACIFFAGISALSAQLAVPFSPRLPDGSIRIKGDIVLVGNNILNRAQQNDTTQANTPYNGNDNNNNLWMEYIDIDNDPSTFSSSSADLEFPRTCAKIAYAGLYWASTYPNERSTNKDAAFDGTPRYSSWNQIKFKLPGGNYIDIVADNNPDPEGEEDDIIFDGYDYDNINNSFKDSPAICYRDVTALLQTLPNAQGTYTVANINATRGRRVGSSSAGWMLVIIYEDPLEPGRFISTFDGYAGVQGSNTAEIPVQGFRTLPPGFPVNAKLGVGALEGDVGIKGDRLQIRSDIAEANGDGFTNVTNALNPADNFFNATITNEGQQVLNRNPNGTNTLGVDIDLVDLKNTNNKILPNDETGATLKLTTSGDGYGAFFSSFSVEIIEPIIQIAKQVKDASNAVDIEGDQVELGQTINYILEFDNVGNDDGTQFTIRDILPINVDLDDVYFDPNLNGEVTYTHDPATNEIIFTVPDKYVELARDSYWIRIEVTVQPDCEKLRDACSGIIQNLAYATYRGVLNDTEISDDPSFYGFDNCNFGLPGSTNFLPNLDSCGEFERVQELCDDTATLTAGSGFDRYQWFKEDADGEFIKLDGETGQSYDANDFGTYKVIKQSDKVIVDQFDQTRSFECKDYVEIITLRQRNTDPENPFISQADKKTTICPNDGSVLPEFFLCGANDVRNLTVNYSGIKSLVWEKLDEGCADEAIESCPTRSNSCTWKQVGTGSAYKLDDKGEYRLVVTYEEGCFNRFHFKSYQNSVSPVADGEDIYCETPGKITVSGVGSAYEFAITNDPENFDRSSASWTDNNVFDNITTPGTYTVFIQQKNISTNPQDRNPCLFKTETVQIQDREMELVATEINNPRCFDDKGSISVSANNVRPEYTFNIYRENDFTNRVKSEINTNDNFTTFTELNPGKYSITVSSQDQCKDTINVELIRPEKLTLNAEVKKDIACDDGIIELNAEGGTPDYDTFAVWKYTDASGVVQVSYDINDPVGSLPESEYRDFEDSEQNPISISPGEEGTYEFIVFDKNNCFAISPAVTITNNPPVDWTLSADDLKCFQSNDGVIKVNHGALNGYALTYELKKPDGTIVNDGDGEFTSLPAGRNYVVTVTQNFGTEQVCATTDTISLAEPDRLTASAGVSKLPGCDSSNNKLAEVRITNPLGGTPPYEYSFRGGESGSYSSSSTAFLEANTHTLYIKDAEGCTYQMEVTIPPLPEEPTTEDLTYSYNCDGTGNIQLIPSIPEYNYSYEINGASYSGDTLTVDGLSNGSYKLVINYNNPNYVTYSNLLKEDFGRGANTTSPYIDPVYCYESQYSGDSSTCDPNGEFNTDINDGEYSVTSEITTSVANFSGWISPNDHTDPSDVNGRYMAINIGGVAGINGVIFKKKVFDVVPNQDISIELEAFNLIKEGTVNRDDPFLVIQLVGNDGSVITQTSTDRIPRHIDANSWHNYAVELNPGANTELDIVIRTQNDEVSGNDIAIDDILAYQIPQICDLTKEIDIVINGEAFSAERTATGTVSCNGEDDGSITFRAENFDTAQGYQYSIDNKVNWSVVQTTPTVTIPDLAAGTYTVWVRDVRDQNDPSACEVSFTAEVTEPEAVTVKAKITTPFSCNNMGATIVAEIAQGGTSPYDYQLEDEVGNVIAPYDFDANGANRTFKNLPAGKYVVAVRDDKDCSQAKSTVMDVVEPKNVTFTALPTDCYSGNNDGQIEITATDGNGGYQFQIDGGTWQTPNPASNTFTFDGLSAGTYSINVKDKLGCSGMAISVTIGGKINPSAKLDTDLTCLVDAQITVSATGGDGTYTYASGTSDAGPFTAMASNVFSTDTAGTYYFEVTDGKGCKDVTKAITVNPADNPVITSVTPTDILCNGSETGELDILIDETVGLAPFTIEIFNNDGTDNPGSISYGKQTTNLPAGDYVVVVTDGKGCESDPYPVTINELPAINPNAVKTDITCSGDPMIGTVLGTITIDATGGTAPYQYFIKKTDNTFSDSYNASGPSYSHPFTDLKFGDYEIRVVDSEGCDKIEKITIANPPNLILSASSIAGCLPGSGQLTVEANTTSGDLTTGNFYFAIYTSTLAPFDPSDPDWHAATGDPKSLGFNTEYTFTNLDPGVKYTIVVHDAATGCEFVDDDIVVVDSESDLMATLDAESDVTCFGSNDGTVTFTIDPASTDATSVNYEIYNNSEFTGIGITGTATPGTVETATGIAPGQYYIYFEEVDGTHVGCRQASDIFLIEEAPQLLELKDPVATNDDTCNEDGTVTTTARYGAGGYLYQIESQDVSTPVIPDATTWTGTNTSGYFSNLSDGDYIVYVKDINNCIVSKPITVGLDPAPVITAAIDDNCAAEGEFSVTVTLSSPGIPPYSISVDGGAYQNIAFDSTTNEYQITGLSSGSHDIVVQDRNGCPSGTVNIDIYPPLEFNAQITKLLDCQPGTAANAEITIKNLTGSGNYEYEIDGPGTVDQTRTGLTLTAGEFVWTGASIDGPYVITIYDMGTPDECSRQITRTVSQAIEPTLTIDDFEDVSCYNAANGTITVSAEDNGYGPFTFEITSATDASVTTPILPIVEDGYTATFENLAGSVAGIDYTITVTSTSNNCEDDIVQRIIQPEEITGLDATVTEFACAAGTNSSQVARVDITGTVIGGTVAIAGDYVYEFIYTNGNPSEDYTQRSTSTEFLVSNPIGGTVTINVYDDNGCTPASITRTIEPYVGLEELNTSVIQPTCNGADGEITVNATLESPIGAATFTYVLQKPDGTTETSGSINADTYTFSGLDVGSYVITVTNDATNCELKTSAVLNNPNTFKLEIIKVQDVVCHGTDTGIIDVNLVDDVYTGPFTWTIYRASDDSLVKTGNNTDNTGINLFAGAYYVEITQTDTPFCTNRGFFTITQPQNPLVIDAEVSKFISCTELGEVTVSATGGYGFYEFAMVPQGQTPTDAQYSASNTVFTDVSAGSYDVYVRDEEGCDEIFETVTLQQPNDITASAIQGDVILCEGDPTASISVVNVTGGRPEIDPSLDYLYILNRLDSNGVIVSSAAPQTTAVFTNLAAGQYSVTVTDNYGCSSDTNPITIGEPDEVVATLSVVKNNTCATGAQIELIASGGTETDYEYSTSLSGPWTPFGTNTNDNTVTIDVPGPVTSESTFQYFVRDANLCVSKVSNSVTIQPVRPLVISPDVVTDVSCYEDATGYINVDVTGGLGDYLYSLYDVSGTNEIRPQQTDNTFNRLPAGVYFVQVDSKDCSEQLRVEILEGMELTSKEPVIYNPMCSEDLGRIELELQGGTGEYQYAISPNLDQFQSKNVFEDLEPGKYTIIAQDSKGCNPFVYEKDIVAPSPLAAKASVMSQEYCVGDNTGSFEVNIAGGTAPYSTALNTQNDAAFVEGRTTFDNLKGGQTYVVFIKDANGCTSNVIVTLDAPVDLAPRAEINMLCIDNSAANEVEIMLAQDLDDVIYSIDGGPDQFENRFTNLAPGDHTVTVSYFGCQRTVDFTIDAIDPLNLAVGQSNINQFTMEPTGGVPPYQYYVNDESQGSNPTYIIRRSGIYEVKVIDANGCEVIAQIEMEFIDINIPNVFTPDGDNNNDTWTPKNTLHFPNILTKVYDRYGRQVAELRIGEEWDGRYNGEQLPTGDYWYVVKLNGEEDDREFVGHFTLYR